MKAILVVDMPDNVSLDECIFKVFPPFCSISEIVGRDYFEECVNERPSWCPLKHPLKYASNDFYIYDTKYLMENLDREIELLKGVKDYESNISD